MPKEKQLGETICNIYERQKGNILNMLNNDCKLCQAEHFLLQEIEINSIRKKKKEGKMNKRRKEEIQASNHRKRYSVSSIIDHTIGECMNHKLESRLPEEISTTSDIQITPL